MDMSSTTSRGNYYKNRTREWFRKQGYTVELTEFMSVRFIGAGKTIYQKKDILASDGIAYNETEFILWNSKHCSTGDKNNIDTQIRQAKKEYAKIVVPPFIKKQIIMWEPRKQPTVLEVGG